MTDALLAAIAVALIADAWITSKWLKQSKAALREIQEQSRIIMVRKKTQ